MFPGWLSLSQTRASKWKLIVKSRQTSVSDDFCPLKVTTGQLSGRHKPSHHIVWNFILSMTFICTFPSSVHFGKGSYLLLQKLFYKMSSRLWYWISMTMIWIEMGGGRGFLALLVHSGYYLRTGLMILIEYLHNFPILHCYKKIFYHISARLATIIQYYSFCLVSKVILSNSTATWFDSHNHDILIFRVSKLYQ